METNAPCLVIPNGDNYHCNLLSTGYLEDALIEFSVRFKRRKFTTSSNNNNNNDDDDHHGPLATPFTEDLSYWNNWLTNYNMHPQEGYLSHTSTLFDDHEMNYSSSESMEKSMEEMCEELIYYPPQTNDLMLEELIGANSPKIEELSSSCSNNNNNNNNNNKSIMTKSTSVVYNNNDTNSTDSSSIYGDKEAKKNKMKRTNSDNKTKIVYPFGLVKPGGEDGDITLNDINRRILMPPTRPLKHPVGDFASHPAVSPHGPGLSGKAVVALTKIQTQGRGTITIIRTKG